MRITIIRPRGWSTWAKVVRLRQIQDKFALPHRLPHLYQNARFESAVWQARRVRWYLAWSVSNPWTPYHEERK